MSEGIFAARLVNNTHHSRGLFNFGGNKHHEIKHEAIVLQDQEKPKVQKQTYEKPTDDDDDSDVSGGDETDDEVETQKLLVQLPSERQLNEIFDKFTNFSLKKILPKDLVNKIDSLQRISTVSNPSGLSKIIDPMDETLEKNIKMLFNTRYFEIDAIKTLLNDYVDISDSRTGNQGNSRPRQKSREDIFKSGKKNLILFYPHLLNVMRVLSVYISHNSNVKNELDNSDYDKHAFNAWVDVSSWLKSIQIVIAHGIKKSGLKEEFKGPTNFLNVMEKKNTRLKTLEEAGINLKEEIQK